MTQRTTLAIAASVTAFVLVVAGALVGRLTAIDAQAGAAATAVAAAATDTAAGFAEREAAYQTTIAEANRRLEQANQQLASQQPLAPAAPTAVSVYAVSVEQAQAIALAAAPGSVLLKPAELVSYQDTPAYEVLLDRGTLYIDAQRADIIASSVVSALPTAEAASAPPNAAGEPVTAAQAAQIAQAYRGGGEVSEVEREHGRRSSVYEVKFSDGGKVYVDAATGQVAYAQLDGIDEDDEEDDHED